MGSIAKLDLKPLTVRHIQSCKDVKRFWLKLCQTQDSHRLRVFSIRGEIRVTCIKIYIR